MFITVHEEMFALHKLYFCVIRIFKMSVKICTMRNNFIMPFRGNIVKDPNINPSEIVKFRKFEKTCTHKNINIYGINGTTLGEMR